MTGFGDADPPTLKASACMNVPDHSGNWDETYSPASDVFPRLSGLDRTGNPEQTVFLRTLTSNFFQVREMPTFSSLKRIFGFRSAQILLKDYEFLVPGGSATPHARRSVLLGSSWGWHRLQVTYGNLSDPRGHRFSASGQHAPATACSERKKVLFVLPHPSPPLIA